MPHHRAGAVRRGGSVLAVMLLLATGASAGETSTPDLASSASPESVTVDLRRLPVPSTVRPDTPPVEILRRIGPKSAATAPAQPASSPPSEAAASGRLPLGPSALRAGVQVDGFSYTGVTPADPVSAVGRNHVVHAVNARHGALIAVHDKKGRRLAGPFLLSELFPDRSAACATATIGDPVVAYDGLADRWVLSEAAERRPGGALCIYVSRTGDPITGGWHAYAFAMPEFPDFAKLAVWPSAYVVTTNEAAPTVYALDRARMLQGKTAGLQRFTVPRLSGFSFQTLTPAGLSGTTAPPVGSPAFLMRQRDTEVLGGADAPGKDLLELWALAPDFSRPARSSLQPLAPIPVPDFDSALCGLESFACIPQKGTTTRLDPLREMVMFPLHYRRFADHEAIVGSFQVDADGKDRAGIAWFELRRAGTGGWRLHQSGIHAPDALSRWLGAIAIDRMGGIALGFNGSGATELPSIRITGRLPGDPLGRMRAELVQTRSLSAQTGSSRWGDYAAMTVDPADGCTFWLTTIYVAAGGNWRTRLASYRLSACKAA
ncbi:hypothetical protein [Benzoatithermus flavus]|uniref:Uncharacterized protein n=1 Tax=Benzoatithermus flavus TaxID=3108223 RepID=A0ABU8XXH8_9PROT